MNQRPKHKTWKTGNLRRNNRNEHIDQSNPELKGQILFFSSGYPSAKSSDVSMYHGVNFKTKRLLSGWWVGDLGNTKKKITA